MIAVQILLSLVATLSAKEITVTLTTEPVIAGKNASVQCSFDLNDSEELQGLSWK
jgi:hypothetical protein